MALRLLILGLVLFAAGLEYTFQPKVVLRIYAYLRKNCLKDADVLLNHKRIGASLLLLALVLIGMALIPAQR